MRVALLTDQNRANARTILTAVHTNVTSQCSFVKGNITAVYMDSNEVAGFVECENGRAEGLSLPLQLRDEERSWLMIMSRSPT